MSVTLVLDGMKARGIADELLEMVWQPRPRDLPELALLARVDIRGPHTLQEVDDGSE
jgi:hypothetical protein